jgi:hypothetical protein
MLELQHVQATRNSWPPSTTPAGSDNRDPKSPAGPRPGRQRRQPGQGTSRPGPVTASAPVALRHDTSLLGRWQAWPRDQERRAAGTVHALSSEVSQFTEFLPGRKAEFQAGTGQPQSEQWPVIDEHEGTVRNAMTDVTPFPAAAAASPPAVDPWSDPAGQRKTRDEGSGRLADRVLAAVPAAV